MNGDYTFQAKASVIATFATALGMRNPSESTSQMVTSLLLACPGGRDLELMRSLTAQQLHELFLLVKKELRSAVAVAAPSDGLPHVDKLPTNPQQLDARWLERALGQEPPGKCPLTLSQVAARAVTIPMRNTNKNLHEAKYSKRSVQSDALRSFLSSSPALMQLLHGLDPVEAEEPQLPGFRLLSHKSSQVTAPAPSSQPSLHSVGAPVSATVPALENKVALTDDSAVTSRSPTDALVPSKTKESPSCSAVSAAEMLQKQWQEAKQTEKPDAAKTPEHSGQTPASEPKTKTRTQQSATQSNKGSKPKTCGKETKVKEIANGKQKPNAKKTIKSTTGKKSTTRADRLKADYAVRRAAGIPLKLLQKHKQGCGRCRQRPWCTRSCWALKGFTI